ncbi:MAG: methionine--tRNA ligase [Muribaculaceae bacterium]|jgi:methionyl-tRNA synthetase|nr:methionine--tRNA ligase [Muribaculaceae bacterium]MCI9117706.1 methionine--tRNA ligase [Muribaculaceae bacterium]
MDNKFKRTLITTALPYANGPVHIGHLAGVYVPADIYARYLRLQGREVLLIGGSDEHGVPITIRARKEGITPQDVVDRYHSLIKESFAGLGISFDIYSRTTSDVHAETASEFFRHIYDKGGFVEKSSMQFYDEGAGRFVTDRNVVGECPVCHAPGAYGDQCEKCGSSLSATELINPRCAETGNIPVLRETFHWYLPLDRWQPELQRWILDGHKEWRTNVYGQCKSWLDLGLQPRAVTRDLDWGIPVPVEGADGKVLYVWFDAPIGYISNTKELLPDSWERWWKDPETRIVNFIGKDNIVFHCIIFPAMLLAYGDGYQLPDNVPSNEFLNLEGDKISTSRNWAVWLHEYLRDFPGKQDVLRYVLTANAPETKDNDFTWADFQARNNNELVAVLGNFVNRALVLTHKYFDGRVPADGEPQDVDRQLAADLSAAVASLTESLEGFHFREALRQAMEIARLGNRYLQETEPWKLAKTDLARTGGILNTALQLCANLAVAFEPFMPFMSAKLAGMLGLGTISWDMLGRTDIIAAGTQLAAPELLFDKIEDEAVAAQLQRLADTKQANLEAAWRPAEQQPDVDFDTFCRSDLRVGTVLECARVPKADKLLRFLIDDGTGKPRTIVSGIAKSYPEPEALVGRQVLFIANLPARKLRGIESQGMLLSAEDKDGRLVLATVSDAVAPGAQVK